MSGKSGGFFASKGYKNLMKMVYVMHVYGKRKNNFLIGNHEKMSWSICLRNIDEMMVNLTV